MVVENVENQFFLQKIVKKNVLTERVLIQTVSLILYRFLMKYILFIFYLFFLNYANDSASFAAAKSITQLMSEFYFPTFYVFFPII